MGNLRESDISISPLGDYGKCVRFPKISPIKNVVKISSIFAVTQPYYNTFGKRQLYLLLLTGK